MYSEDLLSINRRDFLKLGGLAGAVLLGSGGTVLARTGSPLKAEFKTAAARNRVPVELLLAMGYVNTLWEMPPPTASDYEPGDLHGRGAYGIMQLLQNPSRNTLGRAAKLTRFSEDELKRERAANIQGGAAVLADIQGKNKPPDLDGWYDAVAEYGGIELYAQEVFETLESGASATISTGERLSLAPQDVEVPQLYTTQTSADYPKAIWRPAHRSNRTNANRGPAKINIIVIHVAQGSFSGTINWFKDPQSNVSAHYVVGRRGRVAQCVHDEDIAWHAGNWRYNTRSIGIEHSGYAGNPKTWTKSKYRASARLSAYLCRRYRIPIDRNHIIGHREVPGVNKTCPGRHFNFTRYLRLVRHYRWS